MPRLEGVQVIETVRDWFQAPILVISGRSGSAGGRGPLRPGLTDTAPSLFDG